MTEKQLRSLGKLDLLKLLRDSELEIEQLNERIAEYERQFEEKRLALGNAGSIAEAALQINDMFNVAQKSADVYIYNIKQMEEKCRIETEEMQEQARKKAEEMLREAELKCSEREAQEKKYVEEQWAGLQEKLSNFSNFYMELGELMRKINIVVPSDRDKKDENEEQND